MKSKLLSWLNFFRAVNLPTVPGDVFVGIASAITFDLCSQMISTRDIVIASISSCFVYLFGVGHNDVVGSKSDGKNRPIPNGEISLSSANIAIYLCLAIGLILPFFYPPRTDWFRLLCVLTILCIFYNKIKSSFLMGLCRGFNVACGIALAGGFATMNCNAKNFLLAMIAPLLWTLYITILTFLAKSESKNPSRRLLITHLIASIVYIQMIAMLIFYIIKPCEITRSFLIALAVLLVVLRLMKRIFPKVSAT